MRNYVPIFEELVDSSMWKEPLHVRVVWVTLLSIKEKDHIIRLPLHKIANKANLGDDGLFLDAMKVLSAPDRKITIPQPFEGRRIEEVEEGWKVLNGEYYQDLMREVNRKARVAKAQRNYRMRQGIKAVEKSAEAKVNYMLKDAGVMPVDSGRKEA